MTPASKKATFNLHHDVIEALDEAVRRGAAPNRSVLVERALRRELKALRRQWERAQLEEAIKDPLFLKDVEDVEENFKNADAETARMIG